MIPTYNRVDFIKTAIYSAIGQTYPNYEIIVVDDGSTDNTENVISSIRHPRLFYYKVKNGERAAARNFGVTKATGDYVTFLDSDDFVLPHHFQTAHDFIKQHNGPEIFYQLNNFLDVKHREINRAHPIKGDFNKKLIVYGNLMSCIGVFVKTEVVREHPFNEDRELSGTEDHELWLRLAGRYTIRYCNVLTSSMMQHDSRSVMNVNRDKLIKRLELFLQYILSDEAFSKKYAPLIPALKAQAWSYLSLHFALTDKNRKDSFYYFRKALWMYPGFVLQKRFYAILKHLIS